MALWRHLGTLRHGSVTEEGCPGLGWDLSGRFISWQSRTMDKQAMKDEVHFKKLPIIIEGRVIIFYSQKSSNGPRDERPTSAFIAALKDHFYIYWPLFRHHRQPLINEQRWADFSISAPRGARLKEKPVFSRYYRYWWILCFADMKERHFFPSVSQNEIQNLKCAACYKVHACVHVWVCENIPQLIRCDRTAMIPN